MTAAPRILEEKAVSASALATVERAGSTGEKQLARMLSHYGVRFCYEHPLAVVDRGKVRVWCADLWLPEYGVAIEYVGRPEDRDYLKGIAHKREVYETTGIPCVFIDAQGFHGHWPKYVLGEIRKTLDARLAHFDRFVGDEVNPKSLELSLRVEPSG